MILTYNDIMTMGFRIGGDIKQSTVDLAIETAELYYLQPSLSDEDYNTLAGLSATDPLVKGGVYTHDGKSVTVAGLKKALAHIAYAELLRMNISATTFGSVQKDDEYSTNVDPREQIRYFVTVGLRYVRQVCDVLGMRLHSQTGVARETYYTTRKEEKGWR